MSEDRYEQIDRPFYDAEIAPMLPERVLDFHTHIWSAANWQSVPWQSGDAGGTYMVTTEQYHAATLLADAQRCFPDRPYEAVCFGFPTPIVDWALDTAFVAAAARENQGLWPLVLAGKDLGLSRQQYAEALETDGFHGFKVLLNWLGDDYGQIRVEDMIGPLEIALANERRLIVLLHVPRSGRLADPEVQAGVRWLAGECPQASIVLAHCGRCYLPTEMKAAIGAIVDLPNVWMDTSMVMDPVVLWTAMDAIGPERLLFATDFPVAAMRGRRVRVMDHWVDVVAPGYPESAFRVAGEDIHATYMAWEIALAIRQAGEMIGLTPAQVHAIFWDNGMKLLKQAQNNG